MLSWINDKCFSCVMFKLLNMVSFLSLKHLPLIQTLKLAISMEKIPNIKNFLAVYYSDILKRACVASKTALTWGISLILFQFNTK